MKELENTSYIGIKQPQLLSKTYEDDSDTTVDAAWQCGSGCCVDTMKP